MHPYRVSEFTKLNGSEEKVDVNNLVFGGYLLESQRDEMTCVEVGKMYPYLG